MKIARSKIIQLFLTAVIIIVFQMPIVSCQLKNPVAKYISSETQTGEDESSGLSSSSTTKEEEFSDEEKENKLVYFDYKKIKTESTYSIGVKIKGK